MLAHQKQFDDGAGTQATSANHNTGTLTCGRRRPTKL
jgi:hypothetical protein